MEADKEPETVVKEPETVTKTKHPGRVEAGKRLAELNRQKKLKKLKDSTQVRGHAEPVAQTTATTPFPLYYLGLVPVVICIAYKFYKRKSSKKSTNQASQPDVEPLATQTSAEADPFQML